VASVVPFFVGARSRRLRTTQLFLFIFVIGTLNIALGYAVVVYLGFGPPSLADTWRALGAPRSTGKLSDAGSGAIDDPPQQRVQEQAASQPLDVPLPASAEKIPDSVVTAKPIGIDMFHRFVATAASSLADFAARLKRANREEPYRTPWTYVVELQGICQPYLEKLTWVAERPPEGVGNEVQELVLEQLAQLETTLGNLQYMDFDSSASAAMGRLIQEVANTLSMTHQLQRAIQPPPGITDQ
jgi:hypothetical protein